MITTATTDERLIIRYALNALIEKDKDYLALAKYFNDDRGIEMYRDEIATAKKMLEEMR